MPIIASSELRLERTRATWAGVPISRGVSVVTGVALVTSLDDVHFPARKAKQTMLPVGRPTSRWNPLTIAHIEVVGELVPGSTSVYRYIGRSYAAGQLVQEFGLALYDNTFVLGVQIWLPEGATLGTATDIDIDFLVGRVDSSTDLVLYDGGLSHHHQLASFELPNIASPQTNTVTFSFEDDVEPRMVPTVVGGVPWPSERPHPYISSVDLTGGMRPYVLRPVWQDLVDLNEVLYDDFVALSPEVEYIRANSAASPASINRLQALVAELILSDFWDELDALYLFSNASRETSPFNIRNPEIVSPSAPFSLTSLGLAEPVNSGFNPAQHCVNYTKNGGTAFIITSSEPSTGTFFGCEAGGSRMSMGVQAGGRVTYCANASSVSQTSIDEAISGCHAYIRSSPSSVSCFAGEWGVTHYATQTAEDLPDADLHIGRHNDEGTQSDPGTVNTRAFCLAAPMTAARLRELVTIITRYTN